MTSIENAHSLARVVGMDCAPQSWLDKSYVLSKLTQNPKYLKAAYLNEALKFYYLDAEPRFIEIFKHSVQAVCSQESYQKTVILCHEVLFGDREPHLQSLWHWKFDFSQGVPAMLAGIILLSGYHKHQELIRSKGLDKKQIEFQRQGVKECCLKCLTFYQTQEMEVSSMAWGLYHVYQKLIHVDSLIYECNTFDDPVYIFENKDEKNLSQVDAHDKTFVEQVEKDKSLELILKPGDDVISIHIPVGADLSMASVNNSLAKSQDEIPRAFPSFEKKRIVYTCHSWMLSEQLPNLLPPQSNILKFKNLFMSLPCREGAGDFLKFVFKKPKTFTKWEDLEENTSLRRNLKKHLLANKLLNCGKGVMVYHQKEF